MMIDPIPYLTITAGIIIGLILSNIIPGFINKCRNLKDKSKTKHKKSYRISIKENVNGNFVREYYVTDFKLTKSKLVMKRDDGTIMKLDKYQLHTSAESITIKFNDKV